MPLLLLLLDYFFVAEPARLRAQAAAPGSTPPSWPSCRWACSRAGWPPGPGSRPRPSRAALYLLTQWAVFPLYLLRALIPLDPALYRGTRRRPGRRTRGRVGSGPAHAWPSPCWPGGAERGGRNGPSPSPAWPPACCRRPRWSRSTRWSWTTARTSAASGSPSPWAWPAVEARRRRAWRRPPWSCSPRGSLRYEWVLADPVRAWEDAVRRVPHSADALCALGEAYAARERSAGGGGLPRGHAADPGQLPLLGEPGRLLLGARPAGGGGAGIAHGRRAQAARRHRARLPGPRPHRPGPRRRGRGGVRGGHRRRAAVRPGLHQPRRRCSCAADSRSGRGRCWRPPPACPGAARRRQAIAQLQRQLP